MIRRDHTPNQTRTRENNFDEILRPAEQSPLITDIVDKIFRLQESPVYLRLGFIHQSMNLLQRKAIVLIKYVEALKKESETANPENETPATDITDSGPPQADRPTPRNDDVADLQRPEREGMNVTDGISEKQKRRIRNDMGLQEGCFLCLLGLAEKLKPGIYVATAGNPIWIEERLIELFERF